MIITTPNNPKIQEKRNPIQDVKTVKQDRIAEENANTDDAGNKSHQTENPSGKLTHTHTHAHTHTADHMKSRELGLEDDA